MHTMLILWFYVCSLLFQVIVRLPKIRVIIFLQIADRHLRTLHAIHGDGKDLFVLFAACIPLHVMAGYLKCVFPTSRDPSTNYHFYM